MQIEKKLLSPNKYTRPQKKLSKIDHIVIHYVGNPNSSAIANRNYFENQAKGSNPRYASAHFIVGLQGEVVQCLECNEVGYHCGTGANNYTIGIEVCHPDDSGKFSDVTIKALVELCQWLSKEYNIDLSKTTRHYDESGKNCPAYYVKNEQEWKELKGRIMNMSTQSKWQEQSYEQLIKILGLDEAYWTKDKVNDPITKGEVFAVLLKVLNYKK